MRLHSLTASALTLALGLSPLSAFAASATTSVVSTEDVVKALEVQATPPAMEGKGGGMTTDIYYPGPYGNGITVDASITKEVTPDFVAVNGYCEVSNLATREDVRAALTKIYTAIKTEVGTDGRVRRSGTAAVYPYYDGTGSGPTDKMSGSVNIFIRIAKLGAAQRIADILDTHGCSPGWDVRMVNTEDYETGILDDLITRLNKRKTVFEKLLKKKLTNVTGASLSTWVDGYSSYDPETNKADATTTLSITFSTGNARVSTPTPINIDAMPKG